MASDPPARAVTYVPHTDLAELLSPAPGRRMPMRGFDAEFVDIADYIIRITWRIWEGGDVARIHDYYERDAVIHTLAGAVRGASAVVESTRATLAAFPDRTLWGDHVIWSGDDARGFVTSHRITSHMTNHGASAFGPATGRRATVCTIADCAVRENRIAEEWLVRDNLALAVQLGFDPHALAREQAARTGAELRAWWGAQAEEVRARGIARREGAGALPTMDEQSEAGAQAEAFARAVLGGLWLGDARSVIENAYAPNATACAPSGRALFGHGEIETNARSLRAVLSDVALCVDHACAVRAPDGPPDGFDLAVRWRVSAHHRGAGLYGATSGQPVFVLGITHWRVRDGKIREEWTVFDELAVLQQIYGAAA